MLYDDALSTCDRVPRRWWTEETRQWVALYRIEVMTCQAGVKQCVRAGFRTSARACYNSLLDLCDVISIIGGDVPSWRKIFLKEVCNLTEASVTLYQV